jgi:hypothetical protein
MSLLGDAIGGAFSAIMPTAVTDGVQKIKNWYNEKDLQELIEKHYKDSFGDNTWPEEFDPNNISFVNAYNAIPVNSHTKYGTIAKNVVETIDNYLNKRAERHFWSKGKKGDPLQRFLLEWRRWAIDKLAALDDSPGSDTIVYKRLEYLEAILEIKNANNESYFQTGIYKRENTKFDTFEQMKENLDEYQIYKALREQQKSVHDTLVESIPAATTYYNSSLNFCYLAADIQAHANNFRPKRFYNFQTNKNSLSSTARDIFTRLHKSYKGSILKSILEMSYINFSNTSKATPPVTDSPFYTFAEKFISKENPDVKDKKMIAFPWSTPENKAEHLKEFQDLGRDVLNISELTAALELAIQQTANAGNVWAKGAGEKALLDMMADYKSAMLVLETHFNTFLQKHTTLRRQKFGASTSTEATYWKNNFKKMKKEYLILRNASSSESEIFNIFAKAELKLITLPANTAEDVNVAMALHNRNAHRRGLPIITSENNPALPISNEDAAKVKFDFEVTQFRKKAGALQIPLVTVGLFTLINKPHFQSFNSKTSQRVEAFDLVWNESDSYQNWMDGFTTRDSEFLNTFNTIISTINKTLQPENRATLQNQKDEIESKKQILAKIFEDLNKKINDEAPNWKYKKFGIISLPVRLGKPFNRKARNFANTLRLELKNQREKSFDLIKQALEILDSVKPENVPVDNMGLLNASEPAPALNPSPVSYVQAIQEQIAIDIATEAKAEADDEAAEIEHKAFMAREDEYLAAAEALINKQISDSNASPVLPGGQPIGALAAPAAALPVLEDATVRLNVHVFHVTMPANPVLIPSPKSTTSTVLIEEVKEEKIQEIDESFHDRFDSFSLKFFAWKIDMSNPLIFFPDENALMKFFEDGKAFKDVTAPYDFNIVKMLMAMLIQKIDKFVALPKHKNSINSSFAQLKLFSIILKLASRESPESYQQHLDEFDDLRKKTFASNLQSLTFYRQSRTESLPAQRRIKADMSKHSTSPRK